MDLTDFKYYWNDVPGKGLCRNNLIYTSLINHSKSEFCMWFKHNSEYHQGHEQVVDQDLMESKYSREKDFLLSLDVDHKDIVPELTRIDSDNQAIYFKIQGVDFWQESHGKKYEEVLPDWEKQMLRILEKHKQLGIYKYSLHPSSYWVVDRELKNVNYFFAYKNDEPNITVKDHLSHISTERQKELMPQMTKLGIEVDKPYPFDKLQILCLESFRNVYPDSFIDKAISIYK